MMETHLTKKSQIHVYHRGVILLGSGEFGPFTIQPSHIFREFRELLVGEFGPQLENSAN